MNTVENTLERFGLTSHESRVYMTLLKLGEGTAYAIAKHSGMKRPTVYGVLEILREKELVIMLPHAKKQVYVVKDPQTFIDEKVSSAHTQIQEARELLPKLMALKRGNHKPNIMYYEGKEGIRQGHEYSDSRIVSEGTIVGLYAYSPEKQHLQYTDIIRTSFLHLGKQGVTLRGIIPPGQGAHEFQEFIDTHNLTWDIRFFPLSVYSSKISIEVSGSLIRIISRHANKMILIEDFDIAETLTQTFEMLWMCEDTLAAAPTR